MADLSQVEWQNKLNADDDGLILDVRTPEECENGIIQNAIQLDIYQGQEFLNGLDNLDKNKHYYVYCKSGGRSAQACSIMKQLGFKKAYNLLGGITEWQGELVKN